MSTDTRIDFEAAAKQIVTAAAEMYGDYEISRAIAQIYRDHAEELRAATKDSK